MINKLLILSLFITIPAPCFAYLDPGTGSMALQLIIAGFLGAIFTIKTWWHSLAAFFSRIIGK